MKIFIRIFNVVVGTVTALVLVAALGFVVPRAFRINPYVVLSGSMEPEIHTGSVAFVNTRDTDVQKGDVITYRLSKADGTEALVTHRIIGEDESGYITKGDANETEDMTRVQNEQIVGTCLFSVPQAGYLITNRKLMVVASGWILLLNIISFILSGYTDDNSKEPNQEDGSKPQNMA